jgi:hypothetical protein
VWTDDFGYARRFAVAETEQVIEAVGPRPAPAAAGAVVEANRRVFENPGRAANTFLMSDPTLFRTPGSSPRRVVQREARGRIAAPCAKR